MMIIIMMMVIIGSLGVMMMEVNFFNGTMVAKNRRARRHKLRKNSCPLLGSHQDDEIGVIQKTRKKRQKNCGNNRELFLTT